MRENIKSQNMKWGFLLVVCTKYANQLYAEFIVSWCEQPLFEWSTVVGTVVGQRGVALGWPTYIPCYIKF
jgi:hypothetical protein